MNKFDFSDYGNNDCDCWELAYDGKYEYYLCNSLTMECFCDLSTIENMEAPCEYFKDGIHVQGNHDCVCILGYDAQCNSIDHDCICYFNNCNSNCNSIDHDYNYSF